MDILGVDIKRPAIVGRELEVQAVILDDILVLDLAARQRLLDAAGGNVGRRRAAVARTPAVARKRDIAAIEDAVRSEEHTSELQSLLRNSYAVFCLKKTTKKRNKQYSITATITPPNLRSDH